MFTSTPGPTRPTGTIIKTDTMITVGEDYPIFADAWAYASKASIAAGATLTIQLPANGTSRLIDPFGDVAYEDKDFSRIVIRGASKISSLVSAVSGFAGVLGTYGLTLTVSAAVAAAAAASGFILLEPAVALSAGVYPRMSGYFKVTATTSTTVTIQITTTVSMTAPSYVANGLLATVLPTTVKVSEAKTFMTLRRSKSPVLRSIGIVGAYDDAGFTNAVSHRAFDIEASDLNFYSPAIGAVSDPYFSVGIYGFSSGILAQLGSRIVGPFAVSGTGREGVVIATGATIASAAFIVSNCARLAAVNLLYAASGASIVTSTNATWKPTCIGGGQGPGVTIQNNSEMTVTAGCINSNTGTDLTASNCSMIVTGGASSIIVGTQSPASNTLGNNQSFIRRP